MVSSCFYSVCPSENGARSYNFLNKSGIYFSSFLFSFDELSRILYWWYLNLFYEFQMKYQIIYSQYFRKKNTYYHNPFLLPELFTFIPFSTCFYFCFFLIIPLLLLRFFAFLQKNNFITYPSLKLMSSIFLQPKQKDSSISHYLNCFTFLEFSFLKS